MGNLIRHCTSVILFTYIRTVSGNAIPVAHQQCQTLDSTTNAH